MVNDGTRGGHTVPRLSFKGEVVSPASPRLCTFNHYRRFYEVWAEKLYQSGSTDTKRRRQTRKLAIVWGRGPAWSDWGIKMVMPEFVIYLHDRVCTKATKMRIMTTTVVGQQYHE